MASVEERFKAAVNVIKNLPKNGPYQPSTSMMLQFYGLYKQATEGPCPKNGPPFWDVMGKAKWGGWNQFRQLTKEQAMEMYVEKLKAIIETMSFTENVQNFVGSLSGLENINLDELNMVAPGMKELAESHPNSPFNSRTNSPQHGHSTVIVNGAEGGLNDDNMFVGDTVKNDKTTNMGSMKKGQLNKVAKIINEVKVHPSTSSDDLNSGNLDQSDDDEYADPFDVQNEIHENIIRNTELLKQVQRTVNNMNVDIKSLNQHVSDLQKSVFELSFGDKAQSFKPSMYIFKKSPKWWPLSDISLQWFIILLLWPFVVKRIRLLFSARNCK